MILPVFGRRGDSQTLSLGSVHSKSRLVHEVASRMHVVLGVKEKEKHD